MTATFGKLEKQTLTLQPGLNIIEAPNEWGKSTWCAFIIAMLYGIATRERTTQDALADKERYAPWSGSPMSGRMELNWNGRDITIERSTKGRSIFGVFRAFETHTGLELPELTAANCGQMLLGVEKSVFTRAGFLKLTDLPVTQDKALWQRLNALVTTGDESGTSGALEQKLRDLKNQCMSNRANGLIPQVLKQKQAAEATLSQLENLRIQQHKLEAQQQSLEQWRRDLTNHQAALAYQEAQTNTQRVVQAQRELTQARDTLARLEALCAQHPDRRELEKQAQELKELQMQTAALQMELQMLPPMPAAPAAPAQFRDMTPEEAAVRTEQDAQRYAKTSCSKAPLLWGSLGGAALLAAVLGFLLLDSPAMLLCILPAAACLICAYILNTKNKKRLADLAAHYGSADPQDWRALAAEYARSHRESLTCSQQWMAQQEQYRQQQARLAEKAQTMTCGSSLQAALSQVQEALHQLDAMDAARRELLRTENHAAALESLARPVPPPEFPDTLSYSREETARLLSDCAYKQRQLLDNLGRYKGQTESLGQKEVLQQNLEAIDRRLDKLQLTYDALDLAQRTLTAASAELQRRFAPRLSRRTQELFGKLTGSRYDRLTLGEDLSLQIGAQEETVLRESRWRSDGTVDQLYLALRLAVAEELTPQAPLVLDDALVRFDDTRLTAALEILKEAAGSKQILLFTCQSREKQIGG